MNDKSKRTYIARTQGLETGRMRPRFENCKSGGEDLSSYLKAP